MGAQVCAGEAPRACLLAEQLSGARVEGCGACRGVTGGEAGPSGKRRASAPRNRRLRRRSSRQSALSQREALTL